ncbi:hypothetical protein WN51_06206 [Melipona quadrifasciata]|uniref:Uncharacterized protein n=1 Tax=Melipona quadrifasciata TaxID=166423 RepID=A0A0N0BD36_9HYME|nr:hypothetical protein WN51_06206 [Melipona quadrifasciata]
MCRHFLSLKKFQRIIKINRIGHKVKTKDALWLTHGAFLVGLSSFDDLIDDAAYEEERWKKQRGKERDRVDSLYTVREFPTVEENGVVLLYLS